MAVTLQVDPPLAASADTPPVTVDAVTVRDALVQLARQNPSLGARLFDCDGRLRGVLRVSRDGALLSLDEPVADGDVLRLGPR